MLPRHADWIKQHTSRYFPPPHVIVLAMEQAFNAYGHALDAESGLRLFSKTWQKVNAVFELGRQGYPPHIQEVKMFRKSGVDQYGLDKFTNDRGTNRVEGRSHRDTYRKFGTFHGVYSDDILSFLNLPVLAAGPRLTVNCLKDHRTYYNLKMYVKHLDNVDWEYHHSLSLINPVSFHLYYLSGIVNGVASYAEWLNGDLYETTTETFVSLRLRLQMGPFSEQAAERFKMKGSNDWLRHRQDVT
ncbi:3'-5' exonuclease domain-containing protein [Mycena sanguinolenta]|uniref:3'-5' exonuclease domain-containing protein n=1 Tax=Mycena sanguinolenta TaxID=230812 RepID=A0A8H7DH90_9AGAR|nr:3'-5' exonuclease domain-containing protein [Mycena sanguinolenta]